MDALSRRHAHSEHRIYRWLRKARPRSQRWGVAAQSTWTTLFALKCTCISKTCHTRWWVATSNYGRSPLHSTCGALIAFKSFRLFCVRCIRPMYCPVRISLLLKKVRAWTTSLPPTTAGRRMAKMSTWHARPDGGGPAQSTATARCTENCRRNHSQPTHGFQARKKDQWSARPNGAARCRAVGVRLSGADYHLRRCTVGGG